jgi:hypothetical protein
MSAAAVTIVTAASAAMKTSGRAAVKSAATMTTALGKGSLWRKAKRDTCDDYEKNSQESGFHHFSSLRQKSA